MDRAHEGVARAGMWFHESMQARGTQERRRSRRLKIGQPLKVFPTDPRGDAHADISKTRNVSREGFYFLTQQNVYQEGMRLFVTLPYHAPGDRRNHEYLGQVIRVEPVEGGQWGVAVQLLSSWAGTEATGGKSR